MSKNRMVNTKFWSDNFVVDHLNALDRLLFLYLLTNEKTNIIGIYELPLRTAAFETGIEKDDLAKMLRRLSPKVEYFDGWVYIRRFTDHQQSNPSVEKGMMREFFNLPDSILNRVENFGIDSPKLSRAFDMLRQAVDSLPPSSDKVSVTKPKLKPELKPKPYGNTSPTKTLDDVQEIFDHYVKMFGAERSHIKLSEARKAKIKARLADAGKEMLMEAITRTSKSSHHMGDNDRGWKANIDFIIRSYEQVERLSQLAAGKAIIESNGRGQLSMEDLKNAGL